MQKLENTDAQLDQRLKELRATIRQKRNNVADLEAVLHEDARRIKTIPKYFWVLLGKPKNNERSEAVFLVYLFSSPFPTQYSISSSCSVSLFVCFKHFASLMFEAESWRKQAGVSFVINFAMVIWLHRKVYREIALHIAVPLGMLVLVLTFAL